MANIDQIITRWVRDVRSDSPKYLSNGTSNVRVERDWHQKRSSLFSYGMHFELARWVDESDTHGGYWLLNGDTYSVSTSRHQRAVRSAVSATDAPVLILPYSTLAAAGIDLATITPLDITADRQIPDVRHYASRDRLPGHLTWYADHPEADSPYYELIANPDGTFTLNSARHVLGEVLFAADFSVYSSETGTVRSSARFLSAFDHQERNLHYFLAQLPETSASTVDDAFTALRPELVIAAERHGVATTRQGDIFAVPTEFTTRDLKAKTAAVHVKAGRLLGTSHTATEVITTATGTFARGILTHRPEADRWGNARRAEHRRQPMADRKTWHLIVKNTVPTDASGANRAWSRVGNVD